MHIYRIDPRYDPVLLACHMAIAMLPGKSGWEELTELLDPVEAHEWILAQGHPSRSLIVCGAFQKIDERAPQVLAKVLFPKCGPMAQLVKNCIAEALRNSISPKRLPKEIVIAAQCDKRFRLEFFNRLVYDRGEKAVPPIVSLLLSGVGNTAPPEHTVLIMSSLVENETFLMDDGWLHYLYAAAC